jgi:hypothetical protein
MKKLTILVAIFLIGVLAVSCGGSDEAKAVKTGFASDTTIADSMSAEGATNGEAAGYSKMVGVLVDEDGVIVDCVIDAVQTKVEFDASGKIVTPLDTTFDSKNVLGDDYGMKAASGIQKEWYEQAAFLADYVVGKTVEDLDGIALDEEGAPTDEELTAGVTIHIAPYLDVIKAAVENATDLGAKEGDTLGLGTVTNIGQSKDVAADADGVAVLYSTYALASKDADGMITSAIIDASQAKVTFDAAGMLTVDVAAMFPTKNELGDDYGMKAASGIQMEWYEQAAAFAAFATGKTIDDVKGVSMDEEGLVTDEELATQVTVHVGDFIKCLELATM